jgi:hypothetical protein
MDGIAGAELLSVGMGKERNETRELVAMRAAEKVATWLNFMVFC